MFQVIERYTAYLLVSTLYILSSRPGLCNKLPLSPQPIRGHK